jgi:hypothetical protein
MPPFLDRGMAAQMRGPGAAPHHHIISPLSRPLKEWSD